MVAVCHLGFEQILIVNFW